MAYTKPVVNALSLESEQCGCNFFVDGNGKGFFLYTEETRPPTSGELPRPKIDAIAHNNTASVGDNSASVTPLANTGLPGTQPIIIGVPVGVSGVHANVGPGGSNTHADVDTSGLALTLLGTRYDVPIL